MTELDVGAWSAQGPSPFAHAHMTMRKALGMASLLVRERTRTTGDASRDAETVTARAWRGQATCRAICEMHRIEARVTGAMPAGPAVVVANHLSYVDPLVLGALMACVGIAKAEVERWPVIGPHLRACGVLFVRRGDPYSGARVLAASMRALRAGASVLNFPEGTTSNGEAVLPFRRGIFSAARRAGAPIVPVRIDYDDARTCWVGDATLLPHYLWITGRARVTAHVHFGRPLRADDARTADELAARAHEAIAAAR